MIAARHFVAKHSRRLGPKKQAGQLAPGLALFQGRWIICAGQGFLLSLFPFPGFSRWTSCPLPVCLPDQGTPVPIRPFLKEHTVQTTAQRGWDKLKNGELLKAAEVAGFNVLVTLYKNIRYQQNLTVRTIALVVLGSPQWPILRLHIERVVAAVNAARPGSYTVQLVRILHCHGQFPPLFDGRH